MSTIGRNAHVQTFAKVVDSKSQSGMLLRRKSALDSRWRLQAVTLFNCTVYWFINDFIFIHRVCKTRAIVTCFYFKGNLTWIRISGSARRSSSSHGPSDSGMVEAELHAPTIAKDPPNSPDLNPLDYHEWCTMLQAFHKLLLKPKTTPEIKKALQQIWS